MINQNQMPTQQGMPSMKVMMWMFPIMMLFFLNNFSSGTQLLLPAGEHHQHPADDRVQEVVHRRGQDRLQLLANMEKPKKKSRWRLRLEEMQKQQQQQARKGPPLTHHALRFPFPFPWPAGRLFRPEEQGGHRRRPLRRSGPADSLFFSLERTPASACA